MFLIILNCLYSTNKFRNSIKKMQKQKWSTILYYIRTLFKLNEKYTHHSGNENRFVLIKLSLTAE